MQVSPSQNQKLHEKLPIDNDEKVVALYKHHWFAYLPSWIATGLIVVAIIVGAALLASSDQTTIAQYRAPILAGAFLVSILVALGGLLPVYLRSKEQLVLTDESLLRVLQPSLFSSKVDQLGLQHLANISVQQDFLGTMFGFGHVLIETPGEQRTNYDFYWVANPREVSRQISETHENFDAALQGGRLPSSLGTQQPQAPTIDPQEFEKFLEFQQMEKMQQQNGGPAPSNQPMQGMGYSQQPTEPQSPAEENNPYNQPPQNNQQ